MSLPENAIEQLEELLSSFNTEIKVSDPESIWVNCQEFYFSISPQDLDPEKFSLRVTSFKHNMFKPTLIVCTWEEILDHFREVIETVKSYYLDKFYRYFCLFSQEELEALQVRIDERLEAGRLYSFFS